MIRSYLKLVIIFAIIHQVFLQADTMENRVNAHRQSIIKAVAEVVRTTDALDNNDYESIVLVPSRTTTITSVIKPILWHRTRKPTLQQGLNSNKSVLRQGFSKPVSRQGLKIPISRQGFIMPISRQKRHRLNRPARGEKNFTAKGSNRRKRVKIPKRLRTKKTIETDTQKLEDRMIVTDTKVDGWVWKDKPQLGTTTARNQHERVITGQNVTSWRRLNFLDDVQRNRPQKWVQCMDLITPRLKGYKDDWKRKLTDSNDGEIRRLIHLIHINTTDHTREEILALLSEISLIRFRMFQWSYTAITVVLNMLIRGTTHDFKELKIGIRKLFAKWHLDTSMMKTFLEQARIFRPPCMNITGVLGYTQRPGGVNRYTKPDKSTRKPRDKSCVSRERNNN